LRKGLTEKGSEFGTVHLARSHREGAMVGRAEATRMAFDRPRFVGRIGEPPSRACLFRPSEAAKAGVSKALAATTGDGRFEDPQIPVSC